jgi:hypothetical protein
MSMLHLHMSSLAVTHLGLNICCFGYLCNYFLSGGLTDTRFNCQAREKGNTRFIFQNLIGGVKKAAFVFMNSLECCRPIGTTFLSRIYLMN